MNNSTRSQFQLFRKRRFLPFFITQFCGALNDNLFKNALLVIIVSQGVNMAGLSANTLTNMAAGLFILPFFLLSATAGQVADKYDKAFLIRCIKFAEVLIMLFGLYALLTGNGWLMLAILFLLGVQSTFFGPIKYSIIPQHLHPDELLAGNAQVGMGTFVAILLGTLIGGWVITLQQGAVLAGGLTVAFAAIGWLGSFYIPSARAEEPALKISLNPYLETLAILRLAAEKPVVFYAVLGISWFWLFGAAYLTQVPNYVVTVLEGEPTLIAILLSAFIIGVASGSLLCDRLSGKKVEHGLTPFGALGLSLFGIDFYFSTLNYGGSPGAGVWQFVSADGGLRILLDLMLIGMFGGFYIVPLYALVQLRSEPEKRARIIAANNILNALFMVGGSVLGILFLSVADLSISEFLLVIALMNVAVAVFIFFRVPEFAMRFLIWLLTHTMYRVKHTGLENIPENGGALLVCNHVSFVDALIIAGSVRRPIRFVMYQPIYEIPVLKFIFKTGGAIPICSPVENWRVYQQAMADIAEGLEQGDLICLFPEGKLTTNGEVDEFKPGVERILAKTPVQVVPLALKGLWGSFFSRSGDGPFKKPFRRIWSRVEIACGKTIADPSVTATALRDRVTALRGNVK